jgi:Domain of unknown function (DUF4383)
MSVAGLGHRTGEPTIAAVSPPSPARLYATALGALLIVLGIVGFSYSASFGSPGDVEPALGALRVNGWLNALYVLAGTAGILTAASAPRAYALGAGALFTALSVWGWTLGPGEAILGFLPAEEGNEALALILGLLGLAAARATPRARPGHRARRQSRGSKRTRKVRKEPRDSSEARTEAAR